MAPKPTDSGALATIRLAVLAQVADMERQRTAAGRQVARESISRTGLTHRGKVSLGRPVKLDAAEVARWRREGGVSLAKTAEHWRLSLATVKRYCACSK
jgi:putative DNA-invertase from lambdoid prophage Rac